MQPIPVVGGVQLDPLPIRDHDLKDLGDHGLYLLKGIETLLIIPADQIHMAQHTVVFIGLHHIQHLLVIALIVLLLGPPPLEVLGPELLILHLVDRQDDKIERIPLKKAG